MTTIVVTNSLVLVDSKMTLDASFNTRTKLHTYKDMIYTASGTVGGGQTDIYRFIDALLEQDKPWPDVVKRDDANASYVLVAKQPIPHRGIGKGDVIYVDVDLGKVSHDSFSSEFDITQGDHNQHVTVCTLGSGGSLYHAFLAALGEPLLAFESAIKCDPYSGYPYQRLNRSTCEVSLVERLTSEPTGFARLLNVAGLQLTPEA